MELTSLQIFLIVSLVLVSILGFLNMLRMKKKHEEDEKMMMENYGSSNSQEISQKELTAKEYIETYKSQYSKESIKMALINNGNSQTDVDNWLNKYF